MKHLLVCIDQNFMEQLCVHMTSFCAFHTNDDFTYHVIHDGLTVADKARIKSHLSSNFDAYFYSLDNESLAKRVTVSKETKDRLSIATYFRLVAPQLLPQNIEEILYLDADIIINSSLQDLYFCLSEDEVVAAVVDINLIDRARDVLNIEHDYFNAGMLMLNLNTWRKNNIGDLAFDFLDKSSPLESVFNDQDALNGVLGKEQIKLLDKNFNYQTCQVQNDEVNGEVLSSPAVIHYTGVDKPWYSNSSHYFAAEYLFFRGKTEFSLSPRKLKLDERIISALSGKRGRLIIFGAGETGRRTYNYLLDEGVSLDVLYFVDSFLNGLYYKGVSIKSPTSLCEGGFDYVLIASETAHRKIETSLLDVGDGRVINPFA